MCLTINTELTSKMNERLKVRKQKYFYFWKVALLKGNNKYYSPNQGTLLHVNKTNKAKGQFQIENGDEITSGAFHAYACREAARLHIRTYGSDENVNRVLKIRVKKENLKYFGNDHDVCFTKFTVMRQ